MADKITQTDDTTDAKTTRPDDKPGPLKAAGRRAFAGTGHACRWLGYWAGNQAATDDELRRRIVEDQLDAYGQRTAEAENVIRRASKRVDRLIEEGLVEGLTKDQKAELELNRERAREVGKNLKALAAFTPVQPTPSQIRHRRMTSGLWRTATLVALGAGALVLAANAPMLVSIGALAALGYLTARGDRPFPMPIRPIPEELLRPELDAPKVKLPEGTAAAAAGTPAAADGTSPAADGTAPEVPAAPVDPALVTPETEALTRAMLSARAIPGGRVTAIAPNSITRVAGGWMGSVCLPKGNGVTAEAVIRQLDRIAAEMGLDRDRLIMEQVHASAGGDGKTIAVAAFDTDPLAAIRPADPRLFEQIDVWAKGIPVAVDAFGQLIYLRLKDTSLLLGGVSRGGKGGLLRLIIAGALLDPRVRVHLIDGKAPGQRRWRGLVTTLIDDPNTRAEQCLTVLKRLERELDRRSDILAKHGVESIAEKPGLLGTELTLELLVIDELRVFTTDRKYGKAIVKTLADLAARGLAFGIVLILATQIAEVEAVPAIISGNMSWRWAMRMEKTAHSNMILGDAAAGEDGWNAKKLDAAESMRGIGIMRDGGGYRRVRALWLDGQDMTTVQDSVRRARTATAPRPTPKPDPVEAPPAVDWAVIEGWLTEAAPPAGATLDAAPWALNLLAEAGEQGLKRAEIVAALHAAAYTDGTSPATVSGWLKGWVEAGLVEVIGVAPHTRYRHRQPRQ